MQRQQIKHHVIYILNIKHSRKILGEGIVLGPTDTARDFLWMWGTFKESQKTSPSSLFTLKKRDRKAGPSDC